MRALALIAAAAALLAAAPAARAAVGPEPGVNVQLPDATRPDVHDRLRDAGAKWIQIFLMWPDVEPLRGDFSPVLVDAVRTTGALAHARGMKVMAVFTRAPGWASGRPEPIAPPRDPADYAAALRRLIAAAPGAVDAWEIWNEPDAEHFWLNGPQPERYVPLLRAAAAAVREADPKATVVLSPLTANNYAFLEKLYRLGARRHFDAVAVHTDTGCLLAGPYDYFRERDGRISRWSFLGYRTVRAVMAKHGDARKPLYMSEFGWSSTRTICDRGLWKGQKLGGVGPARQALYMRQAWHCLTLDHRSSRIAGAFWFDYRDRTVEDSHDGRYGLLRHDETPKPAWHAFVDIATRGDRLREPCGDFVPPRIEVLRLADGTLRITASDKAGVRKVAVRTRDGRDLRLVSHRSTPPRLRLRVRTRAAVTVIAGDRYGNKSRRRVAAPR